MISLFSKARTLVLIDLHTVMNKAIDLNSIGAIEQHIRDLESARQDLEGQLAEARYDQRTKTGNASTHSVHATELETNIRTLAGANDGHPTDQQMAAAKQLAMQLGSLRASLIDEQNAANDAANTVSSLTQAVTAVNAKETEMKSQLGKLRAMDASAKAKSRAADALNAVTSAVDAAGSVDGLADQIGRKNARADAAFDRAMGTIAPADPVADAHADALIAELMSKK